MSIVSKLSNTQLIRESSFINGQWVKGKVESPWVIYNPANEQAMAEISLLNFAQMNEAIDLAHQSYLSWRSQSILKKQQCLQKWHDLILQNKEDLAIILTSEQGKPINESRDEIEYAASFITWFAEQCKRLNGERIPSHIDGSQLSTEVVPIGVAALITPWNFPVAMITRKAAAAIAAGCTVIMKPALETPMSAIALANLAKQAGFEDGVFNVLLATGKDITKVIASNSKVRTLSFTGSTEVGKIMLHACADTVKKSAMELGGNAPLIVCQDCQVDKAVNIAIKAKFATSGQDCLAANRIYVHRSIYHEFINKFTQKVSSLNVANGLDENSEIGPLINQKALLNTHAIVEEALAKGAKIECGGNFHHLGNNFYQPTVISGIDQSMRIYNEENFAPIAGICDFDKIEDVTTMANDSEYGLAAYIISPNMSDINYLLKNLEYGMVAVNTAKMTGPAIPFGGLKQSGLGREGGSLGFEPFIEIKYNCINAIAI